MPESRGLRVRSENHVGHKFGRLLIQGIERRPYKNGSKTYAICKCDCGSISVRHISNVVAGQVVSCGCFSRESASKRHTKPFRTENGKKTKEYSIWAGIKQRCTNPAVLAYPYYGGRGIKVCERWLSSFDNFLNDMGRIPDGFSSIDRINPDGNYEPGNCRWSTPLEQGRNRKRVVKLIVNGKIEYISDIAKRHGTSSGAVSWYIYQYGVSDGLKKYLLKRGVDNAEA